MVDKKERLLDTSIYKIGFLNRKKIITIGAVLFLLTVIIFFPFDYIISNQINKNLNILHLQKVGAIHTELFLPKIILEDVTLAPDIDIFNTFYLPKLTLVWKGFGISPFGIKFGIETSVNNDIIKSDIVMGFNRYRIGLDLKNLNLGNLMLLGGALKGHITTNGFFDISTSENILINRGAMNIKSLDFNYASPGADSVTIGIVDINLTVSDNKFDFKQLEVGSIDKDIHLKLAGNVTYSDNFYDLILDVAGSLFVNEDHSLLGLVSVFLSDKESEDGSLSITKKDEYYEFSINSTIEELIANFYSL